MLKLQKIDDLELGGCRARKQLFGLETLDANVLGKQGLRHGKEFGATKFLKFYVLSTVIELHRERLVLHPVLETLEVLTDWQGQDESSELAFNRVRVDVAAKLFRHLSDDV